MRRREFRFNTPDAAIAALLEGLSPVSGEEVAWTEASGRVLAQPLVSDRESPPCDVSAMDGYAARLQDLKAGAVPVSGQARIGQAAPTMPPGHAVKIVTGAAVPGAAEVVIPREQTVEEPVQFALSAEAKSIRPGQNIRRRGENLPAGAEVIPAGTQINAAVMAALATFGIARPRVYRRPRVAILTTGDELLPVEASPQPWQIRDSNGPALRALVASCPWLQLSDLRHVADDEKTLESAFRAALNHADAVLLTGGVSMGDYDYVPDIIDRCGCRTVFHGMPIRPGQPLLGAVGSRGQLVFGLPGNPVSAIVCACRFARPALARLAGNRDSEPPVLRGLSNADDKRIGLWWYRPVTLDHDGTARLVTSLGSGDMVSAARSDGFIEVPPESAGPGPWPFCRWDF